MKSKTFKLIWAAIALIAYIVLDIIGNISVFEGISNTLALIALMLFATNEIASLCMFTLSEVSTILFWVQQGSSFMDAIYLTGVDIVIYVVGILIWTLILTRRAKKKETKLSAKSLFTYKLTPIKLKAVFRVIIYCSIITVAMSMVKNYNISVLTGLWTVLPVFTALTVMLRLSDAYVLEMIYQIVMAIIAYMGISIGKVNFTSFIGIILVTTVTVYGFIEYRRMLKVRLTKHTDTKTTTDAKGADSTKENANSAKENADSMQENKKQAENKE